MTACFALCYECDARLGMQTFRLPVHVHNFNKLYKPAMYINFVRDLFFSSSHTKSNIIALYLKAATGFGSSGAAFFTVVVNVPFLKIKSIRFFQNSLSGGSGHAKLLTLRKKCHKNVSEMVLIDRFSPQNCPIKRIDGKWLELKDSI